MTSTTQKDTFKPNIERFTFTGSGGEYFKIWIVNILLTIVTLGVYSAWAKVRNKQYFYGNTYLSGSSFEYTALPMQILKGRIIAFIVYFIYSIGAYFIPTLNFIFPIILLVATPWIIMKSIAFNAYHSEYRSIQFGFKQSLKEAFIVFVLIPSVLVIPIIIFIFVSVAMIVGDTSGASGILMYLKLLSIGVLIQILSVLILITTYPYIIYRAKKYIAENHSFGMTQFDLRKGLVKSFYGIYIKAFLWV